MVIEQVAGQRVTVAGEVAALVVLLAIFPGFFAYHMLSAWGLVPLVIGNGWSVLNIMGLGVLGPISVVLALKQKVDLRWHLPFIAFFVVVIAYVLGYRVFGDAVQQHRVLFSEGIKFAGSAACIYLIGVLMPRNGPITGLVVVSLAVTVSISIALSDRDALKLDPNTWNGLIYEAANYQALARSVLPVVAIAIAFVRSPLKQAIMIGPSLLALFMIGGRSEFIGGTVLAFAWGITCLSRKLYWPAAVAVLFSMLLFVLALGGLWAEKNLPFFETAFEHPSSPAEITPRQMEIFDPEGSRSLDERSQLLHEGWAAIVSSPIIGDYGGQFRSNEDFGRYIHNALSSWQQFGLLGFILYLTGCVGAFVHSAKAVLIDRCDDPKVRLAFYWSAMSLVLIATVKAVFWALPMLSWGIVAGLMASRGSVERLEIRDAVRA
ncbi:hypothetical protein [Devosia sp. LjRoot3]|uniref:hypothetical protein n=1 Tax=Devosia sp. LjRoot3 TaxID=3342319 RepID=UPI003ED0D24E